MKPTIKRASTRPAEFYIPERCFVTEWLGAADDPALSIARARVEPGVTTAWHRLEGVAERYVIVSGAGRVEVGDEASAEVGPGDVVLIPAGTRQRIANTGREDLVFDCLCTPAFTMDCYVDLEPQGD